MWEFDDAWSVGRCCVSVSQAAKGILGGKIHTRLRKNPGQAANLRKKGFRTSLRQATKSSICDGAFDLIWVQPHVLNSGQNAGHRPNLSLTFPRTSLRMSGRSGSAHSPASHPNYLRDPRWPCSQLPSPRCIVTFYGCFFVVPAQGAPREGRLCGLRCDSVHHREVGVSRSDLSYG